MRKAILSTCLMIIMIFLYTIQILGQGINLSNAQLTIPAGKELRGIDSEKYLGFGASLVTTIIIEASDDKDGTVIFDQKGKIAELKNAKERKENKIELSKEAKPEVRGLVEKSVVLGWTKEGVVVETPEKSIKAVNPLTGTIAGLRRPYEYFKLDGSTQKVR